MANDRFRILDFCHLSSAIWHAETETIVPPPPPPEPARGQPSQRLLDGPSDHPDVPDHRDRGLDVPCRRGAQAAGSGDPPEFRPGADRAAAGAVRAAEGAG